MSQVVHVENRMRPRDGSRQDRRKLFIKQYAHVMAGLIQLDVSEQDIAVIRRVLYPYLRGVEVHLGYPSNHDDMEAERPYWTVRLLRVLTAPLQQPVANVRFNRISKPQSRW